jgi:tetratricopeptide (TPR) repeat protein
MNNFSAKTTLNDLFKINLRCELKASDTLTNKLMQLNNKIYIFTFLIIALFSCSTEKNTLINRTYHGTTAHYNGYFNATELINLSMKTYRASRKEDFETLIPLNPLPNDEEVLGLYPAIDTAIVKCSKVIANHSMPSAENISKKKEEHNRWIDENWLTIGQANYYRRDYEGAVKNFNYVRKFYNNDPSNYLATLWIAKAQLEIGDLTNAKLNLDNLQEVLDEQDEAAKAKKPWQFWKKSEETASKSKKKSSKKKKKSKKKKEEDKKPEFPKKHRFEFERTKAQLQIAKNENDEAIKTLENALKYTKKKSEKARVYFVLAQLNSKAGNNEKAKEFFAKVLKSNPTFDMAFNARIQRAFMGGDEKIKKEFEKMLRDAKNAEFRDQIYYALAEIAFQEEKQEKGIEYLHKSTFYSVSNPRQKGKSYEKLGDISFATRNYISAQKYYDSCAKVMPENYPNAEGIRNKALKLQDLVKAVEVAQYEDSVQRIAQLSPADQERFAEDLLKKMKEDEERRKRQEAEKLKEIQDQQTAFNQSQGGNKWYWNNAKTRSEGFDEFRKLWGSRENEDDWRRSEKIVAANFTNDPSDTTGLKDENTQENAGPTVETLLAGLPVGDSALKASNDRLVAALYDAGIIYKDQLNESNLAGKQFESILSRKYESDYNMMAAFQLYKLYELSEPGRANDQKGYLLTNYPNSDYANYLRDPNFFIKRKEREKLAEQEYVNYLNRYDRGIYYPVIAKADAVIEGEKDNPYRAKYMILKALCLGQVSTDKQPLIPVLNQIVAEYPKTPEEAKAKEMLDIIKNGYSANIPADFTKTSIYAYKEKQEHWILIFLDKNESSNTAKTKVLDFTKEFFSREKLNVSSKIYGDDQSVVVVKTLDELGAERFMKIYKDTKKHLGDLQKAKIISISQDNMKILFETKKLAEYELFYIENY